MSVRSLISTLSFGFFGFRVRLLGLGLGFAKWFLLPEVFYRTRSVGTYLLAYLYIPVNGSPLTLLVLVHAVNPELPRVLDPHMLSLLVSCPLLWSPLVSSPLISSPLFLGVPSDLFHRKCVSGTSPVQSTLLQEPHFVDMMALWFNPVPGHALRNRQVSLDPSALKDLLPYRWDDNDIR